VDFARHPGALRLLSFEKISGIGAMHGDEAALIDHEPRAEGGEEDNDGEDTGGEGP